MDDNTVYIKGLAETKRALKGVDKTVKREIRQRFKRVGDILAREARAVAESKSLVGKDAHKGYRPGGLVRGIRPVAGDMKVVVRESAKRKSKGYPSGFPYPKVYEYGGATHRRNKQGGYSKVKNRSARGARLGAGASQTTGARAFMAPALAKKKPEIMHEMHEVLVAVGREFAHGG